MDRILGVLTSLALLAFAGFSADAEADLRPEPYFISSDPASIYDYPYQLSLNEGADEVRGHRCSAVIVGYRWALVPASCVWLGTGRQFHVRAGSGSLLGPAAIYPVDRVYRHPKFNRTSHEFDVALLNLTRPFVFNSTVRAIPLVGANQHRKPGSMPVVTGWGYADNTGPGFHYSLRQLRLPVVNQTVCQRGNIYKITGDMLCAGHKSGRPMPCGNMGYPLALNGKLLGLGIFGYGGCGRPGTYDVFVRISAPEVRSWIYKVAKV